MRCMERNKVEFWYAPYAGHTHRVDEYGNELNETEVSYGNPVKCKGNISAARGETVSRLFGEAEEYDKIIVLDDPRTPITEYDVLWVDTVPAVVPDPEPAPEPEPDPEPDTPDGQGVEDDGEDEGDEQEETPVQEEPQQQEPGSLVVDENGEILTPWDYIVKKIARSLNSVSIAIAKVNVQ